MSSKRTTAGTAASMEALRMRVARLFSAVKMSRNPKQLALPMDSVGSGAVSVPTDTLAGFIDFLAAAIPDGEIYLFGGVLRDLALFGRRGFHSDIDIVVEGDWLPFARYIETLGAKKNKFGGYRFSAGDWPIDVWHAKETWAIQAGLVRYDGIQSLTKTTVLNWDAILMNWRSKKFICAQNYLDVLKSRTLDIVLEENPNPLGMAVRVFRHLSSKDARSISRTAAAYLGRCAHAYTFDQLQEAELASYGDSVIEPAVYRLFALLRSTEEVDIKERFESATHQLEIQGDGISWRQLKLRLAESLVF